MTVVKVKEDNISSDEIYSMSEGNPGAFYLLKNIIQRDNELLEILRRDTLGIRGSKLHMLYNNCCNRDFTLFSRTLEALSKGYFTKGDVDENLGLDFAIPFLDESIPYEGDKDAYYTAQKEYFDERLKKALGPSM